MPEYLTIKLTKGQFARVDAESYEFLSKHKWRAVWNKNTKSFYATRRVKNEVGKMANFWMHREVMGDPKGMVVDHIHGDTLDNRISQLRLATHAENLRNSKRAADNKCGFKGVHITKYGKYQASISQDGTNLYLGTCDTPEEAHEVYMDAAVFFSGEFSRAS